MKKVIFSLTIIFLFNANIFSMGRPSCEVLDFSVKKTNLSTILHTDEMFFSFLESTPNKEFIKYIDLSNNILITDASILLIAQNFKNLRVINLKNCSKLTNKSLLVLLDLINQYHKLNTIFLKNHSFNQETIKLIIEKDVIVIESN